MLVFILALGFSNGMVGCALRTRPAAPALPDK
jgi:hypothetical protein